MIQKTKDWVLGLLHRKRGSMLNRMVNRYFRDDVGRSSAALAYYLIFSIFPFLIFLSALLSFMDFPPISVEHLQNIIPVDIINIINTYLEHISQVDSRYLLFWGLVFTVYFTMRAINSLLKSIFRAYRIRNTRGAIRHQIVVFITTLFIMLTVFLSLVILTVGRNVLTFLSKFIPMSMHGIDAWNMWRFLILAALLFFALALLYYQVPERKFTFRQVLPGTLAALLSWLALSAGFAFYVENMGNYSVVYGSIGAVIVLLLWLYFTACILILGAELNSVFATRKRKTPPRTIPEAAEGTGTGNHAEEETPDPEGEAPKKPL